MAQPTPAPAAQHAAAAPPPASSWGVPLTLAAVAYLAVAAPRGLPGYWHARTAAQCIAARLRRPRLPHLTSRLASREIVYPCDTVMADHLNDAMYVSLLNYSRASWLLAASGGDVGTVFRTPNGGVALFFMRPARPLARFTLSTRLLGVDDKWIYLGHAFEPARSAERSSGSGGGGAKPYALGVTRMLFKGADGRTQDPAAVLSGYGHAVEPSLRLPPLAEAAAAGGGGRADPGVGGNLQRLLGELVAGERALQ